MTSHEQNGAALVREREARAYAYLSALAERDAAIGTDGLKRAEARLRLAVHALEQWGDPTPTAAASAPESSPESTAPEVRQTAPFPSGAVDPVEAIAARILASDRAPEPKAETEVDRVAMRIVAADLADEDDAVEQAAKRILDA